jgi:hypothetical protein
MEKVKNFFKSFISTFIVMIGVFLLNFYLTHGVGIVSIIVGIIGYLILHPAVSKWNNILWGDDTSKK